MHNRDPTSHFPQGHEMSEEQGPTEGAVGLVSHPEEVEGEKQALLGPGKLHEHGNRELIPNYRCGAVPDSNRIPFSSRLRRGLNQ